MDNLNLYSASLSKSIMEANSDEETQGQLDEMSEMTVRDLIWGMLHNLPGEILDMRYKEFMAAYISGDLEEIASKLKGEEE